jgi:hypothetical protein
MQVLSCSSGHREKSHSSSAIGAGLGVLVNFLERNSILFNGGGCHSKHRFVSFAKARLSLSAAVVERQAAVQAIQIQG